MNGKIPHLVQYQGSKRKLAPQILQYFPDNVYRLVEPFSGMASISIAAAVQRRTNNFYLNDINKTLINLLYMVIEKPEVICEQYYKIWKEQFAKGINHLEHYYLMREKFNETKDNPAILLYLLARCVKGSVRYGKNECFNQSPDKRRHGTNPKNIRENVFKISSLLKGRTKFSSMDFKECFSNIKKGDLVYMDPPYQGVTNVSDNRYFSGVDFHDFIEAIDSLNKRNIDFIISYDGECGGKRYGQSLPKGLECEHLYLTAGLSSQATLLGKRDVTIESLYISRNLCRYIQSVPVQVKLESII